MPPDDKETRIRRPAPSGADGLQEAQSPRYDPVKKWGKGEFISPYILNDISWTYLEETYKGHSCLDIVYRPQDIGSNRTLFAAPCEDG